MLKKCKKRRKVNRKERNEGKKEGRNKTPHTQNHEKKTLMQAMQQMQQPDVSIFVFEGKHLVIFWSKRLIFGVFMGFEPQINSLESISDRFELYLTTKSR